MELITDIRVEFNINNLIIDCTLETGTEIRLLNTSFLFLEQVFKLRLPINPSDENRRFGIIANGNILLDDNNEVAHNILLEKGHNRLYLRGVDEMHDHLEEV